MTCWEVIWEVFLPAMGIIFLALLTITFGHHFYDLLLKAAQCS